MPTRHELDLIEAEERGTTAMTVRKERDGEWVAECTECGTEEHGGVIEDFRDFVKHLRDEGWEVFNEDEGYEAKGDWIHLCPGCK